jgi:hypothetical protein
MVEMSAPLATARPPSSLDGVDHLLRHRDVGTGAVAGTAEVVDHDRCALAREQFGVGLPEPAACTSDDGNFAVEQSHGVFSLNLLAFVSRTRCSVQRGVAEPGPSTHPANGPRLCSASLRAALRPGHEI